MKNTIEIQEAMKAQRFGVEIEMNGIKRREAAKVAATYFGTYQNEYTANRHGYGTDRKSVV